MNMHTKGPWTVLRDENGILNVVTNEDEPWYICSAHDGITGHPEEANARLLAAAPDLLEALENLLAVVPEPELVSMGYDSPPEYRTQEEHDIGYALHLAHAAIANARGAA